MAYVYTSVTEETLTGARDRVLDDLNTLTDGNADKAIKYVKEFLELDGVLEEHKKREKEKAAKEAETARPTFEELLAK